MHETQPRPTSRTTSEGTPKTRVLIVDDSAVCRLILELRLAQAGVRVELAENGDQGAKMILARQGTERQFDLAFVDCQMPIASGLDLAQRVRDAGVLDRFGQPLVLAAVSACRLPDLRFRCFEAGMDILLAKPLDKVDIERALFLAKLHQDRGQRIAEAV